MDDLCKLTGNCGKFVKSHLIPKALTKPRSPGLPFLQGGMDMRPTRRWDSWYDFHLVTRKGEDILEALDSWTIGELRKHELVWSGWGENRSISDKLSLVPGTDWGIREIQGMDPARLRLFFLSLLWRAAATERPEFSLVSLPPDDLEQLRLMLLAGDPHPLSFYPAQLTQLYTFGEIHNHTPIAQTKTIPAYGEVPERTIPIFRFYFDGLVTHVHRHASDDDYTASQGDLVVGNSSRLGVVAVPYETSFQSSMLRDIKRQTGKASQR